MIDSRFVKVLIFLCVILFVRFVLFRKLIRFMLFSFDAAVLLGYVLFFVLPSAFITDLLPYYHFLITSGYVMYLSGSMITSFVFKKRMCNLRTLTLPASDSVLSLALLYCLSFVMARFLSFLFSGGPGLIYQTWFTGIPIQTAVSAAEAVFFGIERPESASLTNLVLRFLNYAFLGFFSVVLLRRPVIAFPLWAIYMVTLLANYMGRSSLFIYLLLPTISYSMIRNSPALTRKALLFSSLAIFVAFPLLSALRTGTVLGNLRDALEDWYLTTSYPIVNAMNLSRTVSGVGWLNYLWHLIIKPIPFLLWPDKPLVNMNLEGTYMLYGRISSISTFTMLGEGMYYGGQYGFLFLMVLFGLISKMVELLLMNKNALFAVPYVYVLCSTLIMIRSTFSDYCSTILNILPPLLIITFGLKFIMHIPSTRNK